MSEDLTGKWSLSLDEQHYQGEFATADEAIAEGRQFDHEQFWVARIRQPATPESLFDEWTIESWIERDVLEHDDYTCDEAEDAVDATEEQLTELVAEIRPLIAAWLDRHNLRPRHFCIDYASVRKIENGEH